MQRHIELAHEKKDEKALNGTSRQQEADPDEACVNVPDEPQYKCFADDLPPLTNERESTLTPMEHKPEGAHYFHAIFQFLVGFIKNIISALIFPKKIIQFHKKKIIVLSFSPIQPINVENVIKYSRT